eukprot:37770_1
MHKILTISILCKDPYPIESLPQNPNVNLLQLIKCLLGVRVPKLIERHSISRRTFNIQNAQIVPDTSTDPCTHPLFFAYLLCTFAQIFALIRFDSCHLHVFIGRLVLHFSAILNQNLSN